MIVLALFATVYPLLHTGDEAGKVRVPAPGVRYRMNMATATTAPWIDSNLWRYRLDPNAAYLCDVRGKSVALAMAEAFAARASVALQTDSGQAKDYEAMLAFLKSLRDGPGKTWANLKLSHDGSAQAKEVLNLLSRRNILYELVAKGGAALTAKVGNPYEFALEMREKLGDDNRILRIIGSELTLAQVERDGSRVRLHLINYGSRSVEPLRVRIRGHYTAAQIEAHVFKESTPALTEFVHEGGFTEFSLTRMPLYAVLDLDDR